MRPRPAYTIDRVQHAWVCRGMCAGSSLASWAAGSCHGGRSSQTTQDPSTSPSRLRVRVIKRHHPLEGQELELVRNGKSQLVVRNPDGMTMRIPRTWTDVDGADGALILSETQLTIITLRSLLHLTQLLGGRT